MGFIDKLKTLFSIEKGINTIQSSPSSDFLDPAHLTMLLTVAGSIYASSAHLLPPQQAMYVSVGLTVLFLLYSFILKLHHQTVNPIPGIPPVLDPAQVQQIVQNLYPNLLVMEQNLKNVIAGKVKLPAGFPAAAAAPVAAPAAPPVVADPSAPNSGPTL